METRPKRAAVRKGANEAKDDEVATKNPASRSGRNKAVDSKAGASGGSGDHAGVPPKVAKGTKPKITVSKGRVKLPEQKVDLDTSDSAGSSPEAGNSKAMPPTPYPARIDFSSSPENSDDGMPEEKPLKKVTSKATTTTKAKVKKAEEPMEDDKESDKEEALGNVSGPKDEGVDKKKTKPVAKKVVAKPKVGSKRAAPPSPKPDVDRDESFDMVVPADREADSSLEKGKKVTATAVRKAPVKGKPAAKKAGQKAAEEVDEESGSNEEDKDVKLQTKGKKPAPATKTGAAGAKGKKTAVQEVKGQGVESADKKPSGKGPKAAAKATSKEALPGDKKAAGGKGKAPPAKNQDAVDDSLSNDSAEVIDASSDEEGNNAAPMDSSTEELAVEMGLMKKPVAAKTSPPKATTETKTSSSGAKSADNVEAISDSDRSGSGSGSDNKENDLDVVMDNLHLISEESGPDNAGVESEPTPEPPKKRAAAARKKQPEVPAPSKPKAAPSAANRGAKNRTLPASLESAKATTAAEDLKKSLLARKSYATRSKVKAKAGTSAAGTTKTKK